MNKWEQINNQNNRFKLVCNHAECPLSVMNITNGMISISSIHEGSRHSLVLKNEDMLFVVSQYLNNMNKEDREKILTFFQSF